MSLQRLLARRRGEPSSGGLLVGGTFKPASRKAITSSSPSFEVAYESLAAYELPDPRRGEPGLQEGVRGPARVWRGLASNAAGV